MEGHPSHRPPAHHLSAHGSSKLQGEVPQAADSDDCHLGTWVSDETPGGEGPGGQTCGTR